MKRLCSGAAAMAVFTFGGLAAELPRYDVDAHCRAVASVGGSYSASIDEACFASEQSDYDSLKAVAATLPAEALSHCDKVASVGGAGSYGILKACIESETKAQGANAGRTFKY